VAFIGKIKDLFHAFKDQRFFRWFLALYNVTIFKKLQSLIKFINIVVFNFHNCLTRFNFVTNFFVENYTKGGIPDYQASALLMAIYFRGMTSDETVALTEYMMKSGEVLDLTAIPGPK